MRRDGSTFWCFAGSPLERFFRPLRPSRWATVPRFTFELIQGIARLPHLKALELLFFDFSAIPDAMLGDFLRSLTVRELGLTPGCVTFSHAQCVLMWEILESQPALLSETCRRELMDRLKRGVSRVGARGVVRG